MVNRNIVIGGALGLAVAGAIYLVLRKKSEAVSEPVLPTDIEVVEEVERYDAGGDDGKTDKYKEQLKLGLEVEREHKATYEFIKRYYETFGKWPEPDRVFTEIEKDHLSEFEDYYDWLIAMEARMKNGDVLEEVFGANGDGQEYGAGTSAKITGKINIMKAQAKELAKYVSEVPKAPGWDKYYSDRLEPRLNKVMNVLSKIVMVGVYTSPALLAILGAKIAKRVSKKKDLFKRLSGMDKKTIAMVDKVVKEVGGRMVTVMKVYLVNDKDVKATVADLMSKEYHAVDMPDFSIDWDKVDEDKLFSAILFIADYVANIGTTSGTAAVAPTGAGAVVGAGIIVGTAGVTAGTDVYALKLIADAIGPAIDIKNKK